MRIIYGFIIASLLLPRATASSDKGDKAVMYGGDLRHTGVYQGAPFFIRNLYRGYFALNSDVELLSSSDSENRPATFVSAQSTPAVSTVQSTFPEHREVGRFDPSRTKQSRSLLGIQGAIAS